MLQYSLYQLGITIHSDIFTLVNVRGHVPLFIKLLPARKRVEFQGFALFASDNSKKKNVKKSSFSLWATYNFEQRQYMISGNIFNWNSTKETIIAAIETNNEWYVSSPKTNRKISAARDQRSNMKCAGLWYDSDFKKELTKIQINSRFRKQKIKE